MFNAVWNEKYAAGDSLNKYPWDKIVSFIFKFRPRNKERHETKVLELGFGSGCNLWFCAREGFDCYGIEGSAIGVKHAQQWFSKENLQADLTQGMFYPLNFSEEFFDLIIDRGSLTCVNSKDSYLSLQEIFRTLKTGGYFCFNPYSTRHTSSVEGTLLPTGLTKIKSGTLTGVGDIKFYDEKTIRELVEKVGFKIKEMRHIEDHYFTPSYGTHAEWFLVLEK